MVTTGLTLTALASPSHADTEVIAEYTVDTSLSSNGVYSGRSLGQVFPADVTGQVTAVALLLARNGTPDANLTVELQGYDSGSERPDGTALASTPWHQVLWAPGRAFRFRSTSRAQCR